MLNCYVYSHTRLDNGNVFYIGIGTHKARNQKYSRAYERARRTQHWRNIVSKTSYSIEIVSDNLTWDEACEKEKLLISIYKRDIDGGTLVNLTYGGEGAYGRIIRPETRLKISQSLKGHKIDEATRQKIRNTLLNKDYIPSITHRKVIDIVTGKIYNTVKDAANSIGLKRSTLYMKLKGENTNNTNLRFLEDKI